MQLADSHCHIDFEALAGQLPAVLRRAGESGVSHMLCVAVNLEDFPRIKELAAAHANIFASVGVHPIENSDYLANHRYNAPNSPQKTPQS